MAYYLTAPIHYLNQCWHTTEIFGHSFKGNVYLNSQDINSQIVFVIKTFEIIAKCPRDNELKYNWMHQLNSAL